MGCCTLLGLTRRIRLDPHLTVVELERRYRAAKEPHERSWYQILWLLGKGQFAREIAESTGYSRYWIGQVARRYNTQGPAGMVNRQYTHSHRAPLTLSAEQLAELAEAVRGPAPEGDHWIGRTVAQWMSAKLGRPVSVYLGWAYLVRLEGKRRRPRPRHVQADAFGRRRLLKKASPACPSRRHGLPPRQRRALGGRRTPHRAKADPAQGLVLRRPAADRAGAAALRVALPGLLCPALHGPHHLPPGELGLHSAR